MLDEIFVETLGRTLTIKVEDNTETGEGIYDEPVEDANQALDDGKFFYASIGELLLLKILPYREQDWRYLVFNKRTQKVVRIDAIGQACRQLPEDHGILFPGGFYLQTGTTTRCSMRRYRGAGVRARDQVAQRRGRALRVPPPDRWPLRSACVQPDPQRKSATPDHIVTATALFDDGTAGRVPRRCPMSPTRLHPMQVWQTPFTSAAHAASAADRRIVPGKGRKRRAGARVSPMPFRSRALVTRIRTRIRIRSRTSSVASCAGDRQPTTGSVTRSRRSEECARRTVRRNAELIIDEFEKVLAFREQAKAALRVEAEQAFVVVTRDLAVRAVARRSSRSSKRSPACASSAATSSR